MALDNLISVQLSDEELSHLDSANTRTFGQGSTLFILSTQVQPA
jgi:hypothetical protein